MSFKEQWGKVPAVAKYIGAIIVIVSFTGTVITQLRAGNDAIHWQHEADADKAEMVEHHENDIEMVLIEIADQKRLDRIQRNYRELDRLERDVDGEKWETEAEHQRMLRTIIRLEKALLCDEEAICD
jgi:hypothetical protein